MRMIIHSFFAEILQSSRTCWLTQSCFLKTKRIIYFKDHFAIKTKMKKEKINNLIFCNDSSFDVNEGEYKQPKMFYNRKNSFSLKNKKVFNSPHSKYIPMSLTISEVPTCKQVLSNSRMTQNKSKRQKYNYLTKQTQRSKLESKLSKLTAKKNELVSSTTMIANMQPRTTKKSSSIRQSPILVDDQSVEILTEKESCNQQSTSKMNLNLENNKLQVSNFG